MPKTLSNLDLNKNEIKNVVVHKSSTAPSSPTEGQIYYNTTDKNFYRYNGTSWVTYQEIIDANGVLVGDGEGGITGLTTETATTVSIDNSPTASSNNLVTSGGVYTAIQNIDALPSQTSQNGKFLTTNGTTASWANPPYPVTSVNTKTGVVSLTASDVSAISTSALVTSVSSQSTDSQVPSAKLFYDTVGDVEAVLETLLSGSA